jgi:hypothetical protein
LFNAVICYLSGASVPGICVRDVKCGPEGLAAVPGNLAIFTAIRRATFRESESFAADGGQFWGISAIHRTPRRRATKEQTRTLS